MILIQIEEDTVNIIQNLIWREYKTSYQVRILFVYFTSGWIEIDDIYRDGLIRFDRIDPM